jgi:hypothetical protein
MPHPAMTDPEIVRAGRSWDFMSITEQRTQPGKKKKMISLRV